MIDIFAKLISEPHLDAQFREGLAISARHPMRVYSGRRDSHGGTVVRVLESGEARALPLRLDLHNHSPTGFEWGYGGSGPAQLALAILADCLDEDVAQKLHQQFKFKVIAPLPSAKPWLLTEQQVVDAVKDIIRTTKQQEN